MTMTNSRVFEGWSPEDRRFLDETPDDEATIDFVRQGGTATVLGVPRVHVYHSPDGFEWGYGGSGPSDLSLNILALFVPAPEAWRLHHDLTRDIIAQIPREGNVSLPMWLIRGWIRGRWSVDPEEVC